MLRMESVGKQYKHRKSGVTALKEVNLTIERGDFISLVGPSGSGKSTLLLMLGGMLSPTSGKVYLDDESLYDLTSDQRAAVRRAKVGFVFQTFNLVPYLTALENVQVPLFLAGLSDADQKRKATELLKRLGLGERLDHKPRELSVGQQQRVALARVLANDPVLILADEPTGNLDPETGQQIMTFLEEINREGQTIVMVTHDMRAAGKAKRTLRLAEGSVTDGESPPRAYTRGPVVSPLPEHSRHGHANLSDDDHRGRISIDRQAVSHY